MKKLIISVILAAFFVACAGPAGTDNTGQTEDKVVVNTEDSVEIEQLNKQAEEINAKAEQLNESLDSLLNEF